MGTQMTISDLIKDIEKPGGLVLPEFQRGYVWSQTKVRLYLESLYRGYPTGSFLIWKTPNPGLVRGAPSAADGATFQLILDGQQRLTSIYALLKGEAPPFYEGEELFFNINFNVKTEEFKYYKKTEMKGKPEWVPVTPFFQYGLGEYLKNGGPLSQEDIAFLMTFFDRLVQLEKVKSYTYYLDLLGERNMDEAVRIFNLVNSQGTPLTKSDLALSHVCALWPEARQVMRAAQAQLKKDAGFEFGLEFFTRCTSSVATGSGLYEPLYKATVDEIKAAWNKARKAIDYLVNILRFEAFIDSGSSLPSHFPLVAMVVYLANGEGKFGSEREKRAFLHWFYAAEMWGRYSGSTDTKLAEDIEALKADDAPARLRSNLLAERGRIKLEGSDLQSRTSQSPFFFMSYVAARASGAVDWFNGLPLYNKLVGRANGLQNHHIFPQSILYGRGGFDGNTPRDRNVVNEMANIAFLTQEANLKISAKDPARYLSTVQESYPGALQAQVVPENAALWDLERFQDFLRERRERLAAAINRFMDTLVEERIAQTMTIEDYIKAGEGDGVEFKGSLRWDFKLSQVNKALERTAARTIAGFMNAKGGTLVIGVSDEGDILGLEHDYKTLSKSSRDGWELALRNSLNAYLAKDVAALVQVSFTDVEGRDVAVVHADRALKPVFLEEGDIANFYVRAGNTTQQLDVKQTTEYIAVHFATAA